MQNDIDPHDNAHGDPQSSAQADTNLLATKIHNCCLAILKIF